MTRAAPEIVINGKFLLAPLEGMPRVGREVTAALDSLLGQAPGDLSFRLMAPLGAAEQISLTNIPVEEVGRSRGLFWEQVELPRRLNGRYALHFTGTAPIARSRGCVVVHDAQFRSTPASHSTKSRLLFGAITPIVARRYKTVATVSHYARDEIARFGLTRRPDVHVIYNGADHVLRRTPDPATLTRFDLSPQGYFLTNSYAQAHKNVSTLFDAVRGDPALAGRLVLFGSHGPDAYEQRGIAVPDGVRFLGRVSDEQLVALIANAATFLFPSTTEGFGLPPLEAMLLGCPTICSRAGAIPEVCGDGAWYAPPLDAGTWRTLIERLWTDEAARRELAAAGRARAAAYTWRRAAQAYLDLIRRQVGQ